MPVNNNNTAPFPYDPQSTALAIAYSNGQLIADMVAPVMGPSLSKKEFSWWKYDFSEQVTLPDTRVGRKSEPNQVEFTADKKTAIVEDYALDDIVPNDDITQAQGESYDPVARGIMGLTDLLLLDREVRVANLFEDANQYPASNVLPLSGTSRFDHADSDPVDLITGIMDDMIMRPTHAVIGRKAWTALRKNPALVASYKGAAIDNGMVPKQFILDELELVDIYVGSAWVNSARRGQTMSLARCWGKNMILFVKDQLAMPTMDSARATFSFTAQYQTRLAGQLAEPQIGMRGSVRLRSGWSVKELISAPDLGYLLQTVIS